MNLNQLKRQVISDPENDELKIRLIIERMKHGDVSEDNVRLCAKMGEPTCLSIFPNEEQIEDYEITGPFLFAKNETIEEDKLRIVPFAIFCLEFYIENIIKDNPNPYYDYGRRMNDPYGSALYCLKKFKKNFKNSDYEYTMWQDNFTVWVKLNENNKRIPAESTDPEAFEIELEPWDDENPELAVFFNNREDYCSWLPHTIDAFKSYHQMITAFRYNSSVGCSHALGVFSQTATEMMDTHPDFEFKDLFIAYLLR